MSEATPEHKAVIADLWEQIFKEQFTLYAENRTIAQRLRLEIETHLETKISE